MASERVKNLENRAVLFSLCGLHDAAEVLHQRASRIEMEEREARSDDAQLIEALLAGHAPE